MPADCGVHPAVTAGCSYPGCACERDVPNAALHSTEVNPTISSVMFNLIGSELVLAIVIVVTMLATWPEPPWTAVTYGGAVSVVALPFLFYPFSRSLWLAVDLYFRPASD